MKRYTSYCCLYLTLAFVLVVKVAVGVELTTIFEVNEADF